MAKLTLVVDDAVISRAKPASQADRDAPILRSVRGVIKRADVGDYRKHLASKYR